MWRSCRNETGFTLAQTMAWDFVLPYKHICILDSDTDAANKLAKYLEPFCKELEELRKFKGDQMNKLPDMPPAEVQEDVKCLLAELTTLEEQEVSDKDEIIAHDLINNAIISSWSEGKSSDDRVSILVGKLQRLVVDPLNVITGYVIECNDGEISIRYRSERMKFEDSKITLTV